MKILKHILIFGVLLITIRYTFIYIIIWGVIEYIIHMFRRKLDINKKSFICSFVKTILSCTDILTNIILQVPANRILTTPLSAYKFGDPKDSFTKILRMNFLYQTLKPRGVMVYNMVLFFQNLLK